jgi:hypothetical protein
MLQTLINTLYRYPKSNWQNWQKFGGYFAYKKMFAHEKQMKIAADRVVVQKPPSNLQTLNICFLTGKKYWHQTIFCALSLQKNTQHPIYFTFYDDGSFTEKLVLKYQQQIPNSTFISLQQIEERLKITLPLNKYPYLNHKRHVYKHIRKLTDIHAGNTGWHLVLDSDMLFLKTPTQLIEWLKNPAQPFYMVDIETAYGYPIPEMEKLTKTTIAHKINVGAIGLKSETIDFDKLEHWAKYLETNFGKSYYLEQALSAMLIANQPSQIANKEEYIVYPTQQQVQNKIGTLHHYVDVSKKWYFMGAWSYLTSKNY